MGEKLADRPRAVSNLWLEHFAPHGLLVRRAVGVEASDPYNDGVRCKVNVDGGGEDWFQLFPEFVDGYTVEFPRAVLIRDSHLVLQRDSQDFTATPLTELDAWQVDPYYLEGRIAVDEPAPAPLTEWHMEEWGRFHMYAADQSDTIDDALQMMERRGWGVPDGHTIVSLTRTFDRMQAQAKIDHAAGKMYEYPSD